ncbi:MAG: tetratricopeptide repeat protein [bacterium]
MNPPSSPKSIAATLSLSDLRHLDPEIQDLLSVKSDPAVIVEFLTRRYSNKGKLEVNIVDNKADLKWQAPSANADAEKLHQEALALARQKEFARAIAKWVQAVALNASDPEYYFNLGIASFENKNYTEAVENLRQCLAVCPIYYRAHLILGTILLKLRKFAEAEGHLKESTVFNPRNALAHLNLGAVCSILKKYKEGIASFQRALELSPQEVRAYFGLAKIYALLGNTENANSNYRKVIELDQNGVLANHAKRGIVATSVDTGSMPTANLESLYAEGYKAFLYSDYKTAARMYQKYIEKKPEDDQVWAALGVASMRAGTPEQAMNAFTQACKLNPGKALYLKQLGAAYDVLDRPEEAVQSFTKAHEQGKADSIMLTLWAKNLIKLNHLTEAIEHLERAVKQNRSNLMGHYHLAIALLRMGQMERAATHLELVVSAKVDSPLKTEAQKQAQKLRVQ